MNLVAVLCQAALISALSLVVESAHSCIQAPIMDLGIRVAGSHSGPISRLMRVVAHLPAPEYLHMRVAEALNLASIAGDAPVASTP